MVVADEGMSHRASRRTQEKVCISVHSAPATLQQVCHLGLKHAVVNIGFAWNQMMPMYFPPIVNKRILSVTLETGLSRFGHSPRLLHAYTHDGPLGSKRLGAPRCP